MKPNSWLAIAIILSTVFYAFIIWIVMALISDNKRLMKENATLRDDLNTYKESSVYWKEKCEHYQIANEALIKYSEPEAINKAAKATPLPKLVMKG